MRLLPIVLMAAVALSACTRPDRFGGAGADGMGAGGMGAGAGGAVTTVPGGPGDPNSPEYFNQVVGDRVFFAVDQSILSDAAKVTLDGQAQWLQSHPDYLAVIEGHADEVGTREYNVALGARRANAAREYLISRGIPATRLRTVSYGKERPVAVCSDESCYSQNRRVVTVIAAGAIS
ncbi:peptidoglycan-associated lipoprotein Pal [Pseudoroseicyclus tamaricis]|uniref:Peptidoglycan-associated lipoprotein n=1 Tax=Pseudoroseicyclus tamaricis TaxID=2705421 RepID=A0A6B2JVT7_9RHOB|nr:peptidoglycan-associated lipoprotein Pal [Pseudoroseicyclus tamaricis]NDV02220.1 peptidoglycan-associated lipoprotein Pal [Pseudoroseicyclus tamaricis]